MRKCYYLPNKQAQFLQKKKKSDQTLKKKKKNKQTNKTKQTFGEEKHQTPMVSCEWLIPRCVRIYSVWSCIGVSGSFAFK